MKLLPLVQGSKQWLEFRRGGIGASDAPCILGAGFRNATQLYYDKVEGAEQKQNAAMKKGTLYEPVARQAFIEKTGMHVEPVVAVHDSRLWQFSSLDGYSKEEDAWIEIKCPGEETHKKAKRGKLPKMYNIQCQHHFAVTGSKKGYYVSYYEGDLVILELQPDEALIEEIIEAELDFYDKVCNKTPPVLEKSDVVIIEDGEWKDLADEYTRLLKIQDDTKKQLEQVKQRLIDIAAERNVRGNGIFLQKVVSPGRIDYGKALADHGIQESKLDSYRGKDIIAWRVQQEKTP